MRKYSRQQTSARSGLKRMLIWGLVILMMVAALSIYLRQEKEMERLDKEYEELKLLYDAEEYKSGNLQELNAMVGSDQFIERIARDSLGLVRPDEIIFLHK